MKGILFKPEMIQAVVDRRKTQTRRVMQPQPIDVITDKRHGNRYVVRELKGKRYWCAKYEDSPPRGKMITSRYQVGETVYIKEAWQVDKMLDGLSPSELPANLSLIYPYGGNPEDDIRTPDCYGRVRSPLHLRAKDARYFIKILAVRAERLQQITIKDIWAEGLMDADPLKYICWALGAVEAAKKFREFADLWDSINPKYPWESNPWVFPYEFELKK